MTSLATMFLVTGALAGVGILMWLTSGCRHSNPHYVRPETRRDETGKEVVVHPAQYCCYECGKTWIAEQRDPAWSASAVSQRFEGYDERKAVRAAKRIAVEERQRRMLADRRVRSAEAAASPIQFRSGMTARRRRPTEVVEITSRKPA